MGSRVNVQSIEHLERLRATLKQFKNDAQEELATAQRECQYTLAYLAEQRQKWKKKVEDRKKALDRAARDLSACRNRKDKDGYTPSCTAEQNAVRKAEKSLKEAERNLATIMKEIQNVTQAQRAFEKQAMQFTNVLDTIPIAVADLNRRSNALRNYIRIASSLRNRVGVTMRKLRTTPDARKTLQTLYRYAPAAAIKLTNVIEAAYKKQIGDDGEAAAKRWLKQQGYQVESGHYNRIHGIDLIGKKNSRIHFIEVKSSAITLPSKYVFKSQTSRTYIEDRLGKLNETTQLAKDAIQASQSGNWQSMGIAVNLGSGTVKRKL
jgi:hypothetical protein